MPFPNKVLIFLMLCCSAYLLFLGAVGLYNQMPLFKKILQCPYNATLTVLQFVRGGRVYTRPLKLDRHVRLWANSGQ